MDETIINNFASKINEKEKSSNKTSSWSGTTNNIRYPTEKLVKDSLDAKSDSTHTHNSQISYGQVDDTSTSTVFTATVPNVNSLVDGTAVMLRNGIVTSASGFTLNVNGLGAKPVYSSMHEATADTTVYNKAYTMLFVYDSTRVSGGCWVCYRGYNTNDNTIGYQLRTNNSVFTASDKGYRYRIWLQTSDDKLMPVNTSTSTNATANRSSAMNTRKFPLGGKIIYNSTKADYQANDALPAGTMWQQYNLTLGYSFNNSGAALTLTSGSPVYMVATDEGGGLGKLASPYYTQTLPNSADAKLYIFLGMATGATTMELGLEHPIFEYRNGGIGLWSNNGHSHTTSQITDFPSTMTPSSHTHGNLQNDGGVGTSNNASKNVVTDSNGKITTENKPTIPTKTSDLTNDSGFLTSHQDISSKLDKAQTSYKGKNVVVDSTTGNITFEDKNNHTHSNYLTSHQDISGKEDKSNKSSSISTDTGSTSKYPSVKAVEDYTHIDVIDTRLQKEEIVYGTIYKTDSSKTYINGAYYKVSSSIPSELILFKLPDDIDTSSTKSLCIKISYYYNSYTNPSSLELDVKYNNNIVKENTFLPNTIILLQDATNYFDIVGVLSPNSTGSYNDLTNKPSIPSKTSDLTNDSGFLTSHQDISGKLDKSQTSYKGKNVVVDSSTGNITFEDKNNHSHNNYLTSHQDISGKLDIAQTSYKGKNVVVDSTTGNIAFEDKNNHTHTNYVNPTIADNLTTDSSSQVLSAKQGKVLNTNKIETSAIVTSFASTTSDSKVPSEKLTKTELDKKITKSNSATGLLKDDGSVDSNSYLTTANASSTYVQKETGKGLFSGSYSDLTNKPSYTATVTNNTTGSYEIGKININGSDVSIYGKDTNTEYSHPTYSNVAKSTSALYKIKTNSLGHIIEITEATSTDIANLGVEITDTVYTHPSYTSKSDGLYKITVDSTGHISSASSVSASDLPSHTHTISNITDFPTVETETITVTSATSGSNYFSGGTREITAKRYGKVVMVYVNFYGVNAKQDSTATDTEIGVLPSGWRPATTVHTRVGQTGNSNLERAEISINTSGEIKIRLVHSSALTNVGLRTTLTFIAE